MKTFRGYDIDVKKAHDGLGMADWPRLRSVALAVALKLYKERACYPCAGNDGHELLIQRIVTRFRCADAYGVFARAMRIENANQP